MKIPLFFALTSAAMAVTPIVNLPPLGAYSPHTHSAGMLGWNFTVHSTVTVTGVGWFDYGKDGLLSSVQVGLWKAVNGWSSGLTPETVWTGRVASNSPLSGDFRFLSLSQDITLSPGQYQLGGLHNGIDQGAFVEDAAYLPPGYGYALSSSELSVGAFFFYSPTTFPPSDPTNFGPVSYENFYLLNGVELGPMLFIVPEPSSLMIGSLGMLVLLRRRRTALSDGLPTGPQAVLGNYSQKQIARSARMTIMMAVVYFLTVPAHSSVTVLWEQYHCSGESFYGPTNIYFYTDPSPVSGHTSENDTTSSAWKFGAEAHTGNDWGWASASSTFVFTVDQPILILNVVGNLYATAFADIWGGISYELTDNLTKEIIGSQKWSLSDADVDEEIGRWVRAIKNTTTYNLVTGHEYKLLLSANVTNADGTDAYINAVLVPEPSALLLLGIGGLGGLFLRRRIRD